MSRKIPALLFFALSFSNAIAATSQNLCAVNYFLGVPPKIVAVKIGEMSEEIGYSGYALRFSGITRTPLWSAEHLTAGRVADACVMNCHDKFHTDPNLAQGFRSELSDYSHSGYDRGHMAPSADMPDQQSQAESFSLAYGPPTPRQ